MSSRPEEPSRSWSQSRFFAVEVATRGERQKMPRFTMLSTASSERRVALSQSDSAAAR
ncbi:conserved hypothetical protein [Ricinus communis]|uniref:Uncharacterized protein n=1 Tax=Ricinus communis TaxID=3988 RepID=B9TKS0_RICCO|nr:conserved hypothetical protein [Ricinus communis]